MIDVRRIRNCVDDLIREGYGIRDSVDVVCDAERMKLRGEYDEYNSAGIVKHNGRLNGECRRVEGVRTILYNWKT